MGKLSESGHLAIASCRRARVRRFRSKSGMLAINARKVGSEKIRFQGAAMSGRHRDLRFVNHTCDEPEGE